MHLRDSRVALLLSALLCLGSCTHEPPQRAASDALHELRAAVQREIKDPQRAAQGARLVDEMEGLLREAEAGLKAHDAKMRALNADYDATPAAFRAAFKDFNGAREARLQRLLDIDARAKSLTTAAEWQALDAAREKTIERVLRAGRES